jgi:DNA-binding transcriptional LysR family regulator
VEIADSGTISTAARKLHTSQPNISQSIMELEKELNITIFKRSRLGTIPTDAGKIIIQQARDILNQVDDLKNSMKTQGSILSGTIEIAAIPIFCLTILPKSVASFNNRYPNVYIQISEEGSTSATQSVLDRKSDLALVSRRNDDMIFDESLLFEPFFTTKTIAYVGKHSPLAEQSEVSLEEIIKYPIVLFNNNYKTNSFMRSLLKPYGEPNVMLSTGNSETMKKVISESMAIGFYAEITSQTDPYILSGQIIPLKIKEHTEFFSYHGLLTNRNAKISPAMEKFMDELRERAAHFKRIYNLTDYSKT